MVYNNLVLRFIIALIFALALFLRIYRLPELMHFIGDQGWYYLSARDMLNANTFPLVGIASSHPWLHQGAFWTYILSVIFTLTNFHPLAPGYFTAILGAATVVLLYFVGLKMFSWRVGLIAATLYAVSPLIVIHDRMPYHTSLIAPLTLLFIYMLHTWVSGWKYGFPLSIMLLAVLYNFQISTVPFLLVIVLVLAVGILKKRKYISLIMNLKLLSLSFLAWLIPMLPMLIYDLQNGFPQTVKVVMWLGYKVLLLFGFPSIHGDTQFAETIPFWPFLIMEIQRLLFFSNAFFAITILASSIGVILFQLYKQYKAKKVSQPLLLLFVSFIIPFGSFVGLQTPSGAYLPMFFPTVMLLIGYAVHIVLLRKSTQMVGIGLLTVLISFNTYSIIWDSEVLGVKGEGVTFEERLEKSKEMVNKADEMRYNIVGKGPGSQFASFTMNYEYLTWWLGNGPSDKPEKLQFIVDR
jgi:hypothetical protein